MKSVDIRDIPDGYVAFNGAKHPKEVATMEDLYDYLTALFEVSDDTVFAAAGLEVIEKLKMRVTLPRDRLISATEAFAIIDSLKSRQSAIYKKSESGQITINQSKLKHVLNIINEIADIRENIETTRVSAEKTLKS